MKVSKFICKDKALDTSRYEIESYDGKQAYYLVNNSITESDSVVINWAGNCGKGYYVDNTTKTAWDKTSLSFNLDASEGVLIVVEQMY